MKLYKDSGTNPFASCLPILLQMPIFFALFRLIDQAAKHGTAHGFMTAEQAQQFGEAELFGKIPLAASFTSPQGLVSVQIVAALLVLAMTATTFTTQRQLMSKNMPKDALTGPYAQQQKMLLYVLPVVFAVGGIAFPIGVLLYWTTSNLWTMGQQFYVIRNNPAPGTEAFRMKEERDAKKAAGDPGGEVPPTRRRGRRRRSRRSRSLTGGRRNGSSPSASPSASDRRRRGAARAAPRVRPATSAARTRRGTGTSSERADGRDARGREPDS